MPLTGNPKITPSKKFQPMCNPMGSHSCFVKTYPRERNSPARKIPEVEIHDAPGLNKWRNANTSDERITPPI
jgi:hypothetical protein